MDHAHAGTLSIDSDLEDIVDTWNRKSRRIAV